MKYYLLGIKGSGMCALANILADLGYKVLGCDYDKHFFTETRLRQSIEVDSFDKVVFDKTYFYIIGNAYRHSASANRIREEGLSYANYPDFIESFFQIPKIGVCGSHGKTTTTNFIAQLSNISMNVLAGDGTGIGKSDAKYLVFEACEYQNNFLKYSYDYLIITNIDYDHPDFFKTPASYHQAFQEVVKKSKIVILNYDDCNSRSIEHENMYTFGFSSDAMAVIEMVDERAFILSFANKTFKFMLPFYGKHFIYDFVAAFLVCFLVGCDYDKVKKNVGNLHLPERRVQEYYVQKRDLVLVDDYAHHPTEIRAVIQSMRLKYPHLPLTIVYQPHTYSRTKTFLSQYVEALKLADTIYIMPIFSSVREGNIEPLLLLKADKSFLPFTQEQEKSFCLAKGIIIVFMGAGDIGDVYQKILHSIQ